jgi:hypothetical protein
MYRVALFIVILILTSCGTSPSATPATQTTQTAGSPVGKATAQVVITLFATDIPVATATPSPTQTPAPTDTPELTPTPAPTQAPIVLSGTGDSIVDVPEHGAGAIHVTGNKGSRFFAIQSYDADNKQIDLLVNTTEPYDGVRLFDAMEGEKTVRLKISATGAWAVEILPPTQMRHEAIPGVIKGEGDDAFLLTGGKPDTAKIKGNKTSRFFAVMSLPKSGRKDLLVNTTEPYEGTVMMGTDTIVIEVRAEGEWSIDVTTK